MSSMGAFGSHPGDINKALRARYLKGLCMPTPYDVVAPFVHTTEGEPTVFEGVVPVLLPHQMMSAIWHTYPDEFIRMYHPDGCQEFWEACDRWPP